MWDSRGKTKQEDHHFRDFAATETKNVNLGTDKGKRFISLPVLRAENLSSVVVKGWQGALTGDVLNVSPCGRMLASQPWDPVRQKEKEYRVS